jgi:ABC-type taurine transport system ATPase subunit
MRGDRHCVCPAEPFSALDAFTRVDLPDHLLDLWADLRPMLIVKGRVLSALDRSLAGERVCDQADRAAAGAAMRW